MNIHQFLTSYSYGDAIGNEALEIRNFLRDQGHHSEIFALFYHPRYADQIINYLEYDRYSAPENIIIFHFSIGSPVTKKFLRAPDKKVIIYHNITPFEFFLDYHRVLAKDCYKGRIELKNLADRVDLALGDTQERYEGCKLLGLLELSDEEMVKVADPLFDSWDPKVRFEAVKLTRAHGGKIRPSVWARVDLSKALLKAILARGGRCSVPVDPEKHRPLPSDLGFTPIDRTGGTTWSKVDPLGQFRR